MLLLLLQTTLLTKITKSTITLASALRVCLLEFWHGGRTDRDEISC